MVDVIMAAITLQPMSTSAEVRRLAETMRVIVERRVALTPVFDGAIWSASVEIRGDGINRRRILRTVSATAATLREGGALRFQRGGRAPEGGGPAQDQGAAEAPGEKKSRG